MSALDKILRRLRGVRPMKKGGFVGCCPAHDDRHPSLRISYDTDSGRVLVYCPAGCPVQEIVAALKLRLGDLFDRGTRPLVHLRRPRWLWEERARELREIHGMTADAAAFRALAEVAALDDTDLVLSGYDDLRHSREPSEEAFEAAMREAQRQAGEAAGSGPAHRFPDEGLTLTLLRPDGDYA